MSLDFLEDALPRFLARSRWFAGKARPMKGARIRDVISLSDSAAQGCLAIVEVDLGERRSDAYLLPLACAFGRKARDLRRRSPELILTALPAGLAGSATGVLFDAFGDKDFNRTLLDAFARRRRLRGKVGRARAVTTRVFRDWHADSPPGRRAPASGSQSNSTLILGERVFLKLYRRLTKGIHPEIEVGRFLTERARFRYAPQALGVLEYVSGEGGPTSLAFLQGFMPSKEDAWTFAVESLERYLRRARSGPATDGPRRCAVFLDAVRLLGRRTAEMHHALSSSRSEAAFVPEPFDKKDQRALVDSMRELTKTAFRRLRAGMHRIPSQLRRPARSVLALEGRVLRLADELLKMNITAPRIRCHGDYHLRQVLRTDDDYVITDFEGEPGRPVGDRRTKHCALRDVASMLRSFDYAAETVLARRPRLEPWVRAWLRWTYAAFLEGYLEIARGSRFFPRDAAETSRLLDFYLLEKAVYELGAELGYRPDWVASPLKGVLRLVEERDSALGAQA